MTFFCAAQSRAAREPMFGTVARIRSWLLLEYPSAWRRDAIRDSRLLSDSLKASLDRLQQQGRLDRCLAIRQTHACSGPLRCFRIDSRPGSESMLRAEFADYDDVLAAPRFEAYDGLLYAVCTHGRHDKCCAKFGLPLFCAVRDTVGDRAWQCSHVGGDRFAGNVVVFPYGIYYGHVLPEEVPELVRRTEAGQIWLDKYRGRSCFNRTVQIGEYFARRESGLLDIDAFLPVRAEPGRVELSSRTGTHVVEYRTVRGVYASHLTCAAAEPSDIARHELIRYAQL
jgi:hypothetical protein